MVNLGVAPTSGDAGPLNFSIEAISTQVDPTWIQEALKQSGKLSRRVRKLPADLVVQLLIAMGLHPEKSIPNVLKDLSLGFQGKLEECRSDLPTSSAITQARDRVGAEPVELLFERQGQELHRRHGAQQSYKGMSVLGLDGSTLKVPDTQEHRQKYGAPKSGRGRSAFPMMRVMLLLGVATHVALAAAFGPYATGEMTLAMTLLPSIPSGSLLLFDRGFMGYLFWWQLGQKSVPFLTRAKRNVKGRRVCKLGDGDWRVRFLLPGGLRRKHPELPESMTLRLIRYQIPGFRHSWLLTSLLDARQFPAEELVALYHARWELELAFFQIKATLRPSGVPLRSEDPQRALQEAYGILIAYNVVRGLMADAAQAAGVPPLRLGFTDSLHRIRTAMIRMPEASAAGLLDLYAELLREIAACRLPPRRPRHNPRVVKVKMSNYARKRVHRKVA